MVIQRLHLIPIAQIFLSLPGICGSNQTPVSPGLRSAFNPYSAKVKIITSSKLLKNHPRSGLNFSKSKIG
jgi:hypothetical protein